MTVRGAAVWAMAGQYLAFAIQFIASVVISRLFLSPGEVGLFSIGLATAMIVAVLQDFGLSRYISGLTVLDHDEIARCGSVAVLFSLLIAAIVAATALPMAATYHQPQLVTILLIIAGSYLFVPMSVVPMALMARAMRAFNQRPGQFQRDVIGVVDFDAPSSTQRFHIVSLIDGRSTSYLVAHGRGSDPNHAGWLQRFSNDPGSEASSNGAFRTAPTYEGHHGLSRRVFGLDPTNSNAEPRAIVIHAASYVSLAILAATGKLGRSEGCFAVAPDKRDEVLARLGEGRLIYADKIRA